MMEKNCTFCKDTNSNSQNPLWGPSFSLQPSAKDLGITRVVVVVVVVLVVVLVLFHLSHFLFLKIYVKKNSSSPVIKPGSFSTPAKCFIS